MIKEIRPSDVGAEKTLAALARRFPDMHLERACDVVIPGRISTGVQSLDAILDGGWPRGRIVHLYGAEGSGKSTLGLKFLKAFQRQGYQALLVDSDHSFDPSFAAERGLALEDLIVCRPRTIEEAFQTCSELIRATPIRGVVFDSIASLQSKYDLNSDFIDGSESSHRAAFLSRALPILLPIIWRADATVLVLNQMRDAVQTLFGNPNKPTAGRALRHYASIGAEIRRRGLIERDGAVIGTRNSITVVKSKVCRPYRVAEFELLYKNAPPARPDLIEMPARTAN